jgi:outer membrane protein assembly factor BamB
MITVALVPILLQAGTSVLPTIVAGASPFLIVLLRSLERLRSRPWFAAFITAATLTAIGGLLVLSHQILAHSPPHLPIDWAQVAMNTIRSQEIAEKELPSTTGAPSRLRLAWEFKQPGASFLSTPALSNGRLYGASCIIDVAGTFGSVFCLDATTGRPIWQVEKISNRDLKGVFSSPVLAANGKYLIIGEGLHFDAQCHLICLEAETGKLHWKINIPKNHVESSPAVLNDFVIAGAGAIEREDHLPVDSPGYALSVRVSDGKVLWQREIVDPESSPAIATDGITYIGSGVSGCAVVAVRQNGERFWETPTPYPVTSPISLANDLVLAGTGRGDFVNADPHPAGAVLAINRVNGNVQWRTDLSDAILGRIAIDDEKAFCPVRNGTVVALDLKDGRRIWSQTIGDAPVLAGTTLCGHYVYAVSSNGYLVLLDARTGQLLEKHALNNETDPGRRNLCLSSPLVADGRVFVGTETGGLRCFVGTVSR